MYSLLSIFGLTPEKKNPAEIKISSTSTVQRNIAIVLGSLAEKLAGKENGGVGQFWIPRYIQGHTTKIFAQSIKKIVGKLKKKSKPKAVLFSDQGLVVQSLDSDIFKLPETTC